MNAERKREVNDLLAAAREQRKAGNREAALAAFRAAATADSANLATIVDIATELRALNRLEESEIEVRNVLSRDARHLGALVELGHIVHRSSRFSEAVLAFTSAAAGKPEHVGIKIEIARNLRMTDRLEEAETILGELIAQDPSCVSAFIERGHCRRRDGDRVAALAAFEQAEAIDPSRPGPRLERATELRALGRVGEAETVLRDLIRSSPETTAAVVSLGYLMLEANRLPEAEILFRQAYLADPRNAQLAITLAKIAKRRDLPGEALEHLRSAVEMAPANLDVRISLASELREQGFRDEAQDVVRSAPDGGEESPKALLELARILKATGPKAALDLLDRAGASPKADAQILVAVAREKWSLGDPAGAQAILGSALEREPNHAAALIATADMALLSDEPEKALNSARSAIRVQPDQLGPYLLAARAAAALHDRELAVGMLADAKSRLGQRPELLATHIHVLRLFRDYAAASGIAGKVSAEAMRNPGVWGERTGLAIVTGDFAVAEASLASLPNAGEQARAHFFRGRLAESRRDYGAAAESYREALKMRPSQADWHAELARASLLGLNVTVAAEHLRKAIHLSASQRIARGQSLHQSQHFLGQLLDEFALDENVLIELQAAAAISPGGQIDAIKAIVRTHPDSTPAALMLLLALRRAGQLRFRAGRFGRLVGGRIPKRIVQFWDTHVPPPDVRALMKSWDDPQGVFGHIVFNQLGATGYLEAHASPDVIRAFKRAKHPAQRADIFRLAYLVRDGGFYVDADDRRAAAFELLAPKRAALVGYQEDYGTLANNFIAAAPGHPVVRRALDLAVAAMNRGDGESVWLSTGPGLMTRAFAQVASAPRPVNGLDRVMIRELHEMQGLVDIHCPTAYKRTDRHWSKASDRRPENRRLKAS